MFCNIAAYKFIHFDKEYLPSLNKLLKEHANAQSLKGTILLSTEGINLFLAGTKEQIANFIGFISETEGLSNLPYKYSYSDFVPFKKLSVKIRKEIVTFDQEGIIPEQFTAPYITPEELKNWLESNKDITLLDTRNEFEYEVGAFKKAIHPQTDNFREFPSAIEKMPLDKDKPVITYCTGGIRCEKAAAYLLKQGFKEVYQLQGGILNYFEKCQNAHYRGHCFVFDDRMVLNSQLEPLNPEDND